MESVEEAKYLGGLITKDVTAKAEARSRISATTIVMKSLDTFWKWTKCNFNCKLRVFNAVII